MLYPGARRISAGMRLWKFGNLETWCWRALLRRAQSAVNTEIAAVAMQEHPRYHTDRCLVVRLLPRELRHSVVLVAMTVWAKRSGV